MCGFSLFHRYLKGKNFSFFIDENAPPPSPNPNEAGGGLTHHLGEIVDSNAVQTPWGFHHITNFLPSYDRDDGFFVYFDVNLNSEQATNYLDFMEQGFFIGRNTDTIDVQVGLVNNDTARPCVVFVCMFTLYILEYTTGTWKPLSDCVKLGDATIVFMRVTTTCHHTFPASSSLRTA